MKLYPINALEANKPNWISRTLRVFGALVVIASVVVGVVLCNNMLAEPVSQALGVSYETAQILCLVFGGLCSFGGGLITSLGLWAAAMIIDDLHALRLYASGYQSFGDDQ